MKTLDFEAYWSQLSIPAQSVGIPEPFDTPMGYFLSTSTTPTKEMVSLLIEQLDSAGIPHQLTPKTSESPEDLIDINLSPLVSFLRMNGHSGASLSSMMRVSPSRISSMCKNVTVRRKIVLDAIAVAKMVTQDRKGLEEAIERVYNSESEKIPRGAPADPNNFRDYRPFRDILRKYEKNVTQISIIGKITYPRLSSILRGQQTCGEGTHEKIMSAFQELFKDNRQALKEIRKAEKEMDR